MAKSRRDPALVLPLLALLVVVVVVVAVVETLPSQPPPPTAPMPSLDSSVVFYLSSGTITQTPIATWNDSSWKGNNFSQTVLSLQPALASDGGVSITPSQHLTGPVVFPTQADYSVLAVVRLLGPGVTVLGSSAGWGHSLYFEGATLTVEHGGVGSGTVLSPSCAIVAPYDEMVSVAWVWHESLGGGDYWVGSEFGGFATGVPILEGSTDVGSSAGQLPTTQSGGVIYELALFASALNSSYLAQLNLEMLTRAQQETVRQLNELNHGR